MRRQPCTGDRCPVLVERGTGNKCPACAKKSQDRRGSAQQRGYDKRIWRPLRDAHLFEYPLCGNKRQDAYDSSASQCAREGYVTAATVVHHINGHSGQSDPEFVNPRNMESVCKECHDRVMDPGEFGR